jgi:hypothetical protein
MARIRSIKPEFPQSESIGNLTREARLLFILLFTVVDDGGRSRAASRMLASLLYPYDDDARDLICGWLEELDEKGLITRYEVDGSQYLEIDNWLKHQKIDHATPSKFPSIREGSRTLARISPVLAPDKDRIGRDRIGLDQDRIRSLSPGGDLFDRFYSAYPKRQNRKSAASKFDVAVRNGTDPEHIIQAAGRYAEAHRSAGTDKQYIPAPDVWLNKGGYDDEDLPQAPKSHPKKDTGIAARLAFDLQRQMENHNGSGTPSTGSCKTLELIPQRHSDGG